ncbi:hypothetical protein ABPG74_011580 [Tetrahymena malaccensis]
MSTEIRKILSTDILPVIYNYLNQIGLESVAKKLQKKSGLDLENSDTPLVEKKLQKIVKFYVTNHKHMIQKFIVKEEEESENESDSDSEVKAKKNKKQEKLNKKRKNEKKEVSEDEEEKNDSGNETPVIKKTKKNKKQESDDEEEDKPVVQKQIIPELLEEEELQPGQRKYFQKCDDRMLKYLKPEQQDFSHESKLRFGVAGDAFGDIGNEKLKETKGKGFRKAKDKLKNKNFCGGDGQINVNQINSIPIL